jgi:hypothetical protein
MEKAMHMAHGIGYEEYCRKFTIRMKVERKREEEYLKSRLLVDEISRKIYT